MRVTGLTRRPATAGLPTVAKTAPGFDVTRWMGLFAPKGVPAPVFARLLDAFDKAMADPRNRADSERPGVRVEPSSPTEHLAFMRNEERRWRPILSRFEPQ